MRLILLLFAIILNLTAIACSCNNDRPFLDVAPGARLVALVKVVQVPTSDRSNEMIVEIIEAFQGKEERKTISVYGDNGLLCRPYITAFKRGKYYVIGMIGANEEYGEKPAAYAVSICGEYWLKANKLTKRASGNVSNKTKRISFADVKKHLEPPSSQN